MNRSNVRNLQDNADESFYNERSQTIGLQNILNDSNLITIGYCIQSCNFLFSILE